MNAFERFAPTVLQIYRRDKEAFWAAVMAPFLSDKIPLLPWFRHLKVALHLLSAAKGLEDEARQILQDFSAPLGFDVSQWKSSHYFKDWYPIFAFVAVWMEEQGLSDILEHFDGVLRAAVFGVTGYGILDLNTDGDHPSPVQILTAQALIAEYESSILGVFGVTPVNLEVLHRMRSLFLSAEIKEKLVRGKTSPYCLEDPAGPGAKAAHAVTPFMLGLECLGKAALIDDYWQAALLFSAVVQNLDDWMDLEKDLADGHYSYITLGAEKCWDVKSPLLTARLLRQDQARVQKIYALSQEMLAQSRSIFARLDDPVLVRFVDIVGLRFDAFCRKELKMAIAAKRPDKFFGNLPGLRPAVKKT